MEYPLLFSKKKIGSLTLKNRLVMPGMRTGMANSNGEVTEQMIAYYEERAKGGTGLIITEFVAIESELGKGVQTQLRIDDDRFVAGIHRIANAVQKYGARFFVQLHHAGRESNSGITGGKQIVAPSPVTCMAIGEEPRELTTEEVKDLVQRFVMGAVRAQMAGADGVELHGAHGYLIGQFISPYTNLRTDEYGGSFENRMRFAEDIITGIKEKCGEHFPVCIRLSIDEFVEKGMKVEASQEACQYLEKIGVDAIHASGGCYEAFDKLVESMLFEQGWRVYLAEEVKKVVNIPVITVGSIREPHFMEEILENGRADFIAMGRGLIADPEWAKKAIAGRDKEIRKCISCLHCTMGKGGGIHCSINVRAGRELEFRGFERTNEKRHVAIVGGGPGGMEAARVLSMKGYDVTIFEKDARLGGQLNLVTTPVPKEKMSWQINYLTNEMKRLKVDVRLNTEASVEAIKALNPYAVFLATGAKPIIPPMAGHDLPNVSDYEDVLLKRKEFSGQKIVVMGSGMVCYSVVGQLARQGNDVTLVEVPTETGSKLEPHTRMRIVGRLQGQGVKVITDHTVEEIRSRSVLLHSEDQQQMELELDHFVFSMGTEVYNPLEESYREHFDNLFVIGDAVNPGSIVNAIKDGFEKAYVIEDIVVEKKQAASDDDMLEVVWAN